MSKRGRGLWTILCCTLATACMLIGAPAGGAGAASSGYQPLEAPARLLDTRPDGITIDGGYRNLGARPGGTTLELQVAGRANVPIGTASVVLNVTAVGPRGNGYLTVFPCGNRPNASNVNYATGQIIANTVIARLTATGTVCIFTWATSDIVVDVSGTFPTADSFTALGTPARLLDTRPDGMSIDGQYVRLGTRPAGSTLELPIAGRADVPFGTASVVLNVTAVNAGGEGFLTVFPCGGRPNASNVNYGSGQVVANAVLARLTAAGTVCIFTYASAEIVVDIAGTFATAETFVPLASPARLLDTRAGGATVDGTYVNTGVRPSGGTILLPLALRAGIPSNASAVVLNVTAASTQAPGFVTVYPTGLDRPTASNLNYVPGQNIPNTVIARLGGGGAVCLFTYGATDLVVDVAGYLTGPAPDSGYTCPSDPAPPPPPPPPPVSLAPGTYVVGQTIQPGRYIARSARNGCYWERLSGFGGSFGEILANDFQGFNGPNIVDVGAGDAGFKFDSDCGRFETYAASGAPATVIPPGHRVVGVDIQPGTYATSAGAGCYWERLSGFSGNIGQVLANDFLNAPQTAIVTISPSDVGFFSDADCGTWSRL